MKRMKVDLVLHWICRSTPLDPATATFSVHRHQLVETGLLLEICCIYLSSLLYTSGNMYFFILCL